ncbi:TVP38/TMEM64 family protein [Eubacterium sp.]|uniref:TVP38/TMEM64 family protein n=1 Tax=Eubacterium sp. TaxID=142586 RepID=UPI003F00218E
MKKRFSSLSPIKRCLLLGVPILYVIIFVALYFSVGRELAAIISDKEMFKAWIASFGIYDEVIFVAVRAIQTVVKIVPAEPLEIGAGYIWGTYKGFALCMLGTEIGSAVILILTYLFGTRLLNLMFDLEQINKWSFINNSKKKYLLLTVIYLIPGTPKDFITYFVGVTDTKILPFLLVTGIARIPSVISSTWCGQLLDTSSIKIFVLAFSLITAVSMIAGYFAQKRFKAFE